MNTPKPVTLATLDKSTAQEVFDWVAFNLLRQNARSKSSHGPCAYRGLNGLKCAAGWLIADDEYDPKFETTTWHGVTDILRTHFVHDKLIFDLQQLHDGYSADEWTKQFRSVAYIHGLDPSIIDTVVTK